LSKIKRNLGYQTIYQILNTCLPLITSPYLARVLGAEKQGIFSYTQSIVNYFTLFAMLGVVNYGTRTIAECKKERRSISYSFWNIYLFQALTSAICIVLYSSYLLFLSPDNRLIALIQGLYLIGSFLDANWLFFGLEKFKITVTRNMVVRLLSVAAILLLVKSRDDLWVYTLIMAGSPVISNVIIWKFIPNEVDIHFTDYINFDEVKRHIKPNLVLFIPLLGMSVYHVMDKTMLGILSSYEQVGFYYNADKIINIPIGVIGGVGTVMLPRMSALFADNRTEDIKKYFLTSIEGIIISAAAMAFGIAAISKEFTPVFFGEGFEPCVELIMVLSPVLIIKGLSQTVRMQLLIPSKNEKVFVQSVFFGALANLIANMVLIPLHGALGAVIGTLLAELVSCVWQFAKMNTKICVSQTLIKSMCYLGIGLVMFFAVRKIAPSLPQGIFGLIIEILIGFLVYSSLCFLLLKITDNSILKIMRRRQ